MKRHKPVRKKGHGHKAKVAAKVPTFRRHWKGVDNTRDIDTILLKQKLYQDVLGISGERLTSLFQTAYGLLQEHRYDDAIKGFEFLTRLNPFIPDFWIGLGLSYEMFEKFDEALSSFFTAQTMDPSRPEPYEHAVGCCISLKNTVQAEVVVRLALEYVKKHPRGAATKELLPAIEKMQESIEWHKKVERVV